jgi:hypothetical protein
VFVQLEPGHAVADALAASHDQRWRSGCVAARVLHISTILLKLGITKPLGPSGPAKPLGPWDARR